MSYPENSIRAVIDCPRGGRIVTMGFPGVAIDVSGASYMDPAHLHATLSDERLADCALVLALPEATDLPKGALAILKLELRLRGVEMAHLPIVDYGAPSAAFEDQWRGYAAGLQAHLDAGRTIGVTCHYGAGRSGTIAARLLIERGLAPANAIAEVRAAFPEAIESDAQQAWLEARSPGSA